MGYIDLRIIEQTVFELSKQAEAAVAVEKQIEDLLEEGRRLQERLLSHVRLREAALALDAEARSLMKASTSLQGILQLYRSAGERVADILSGEYPVIPRTEFGTSWFGNLQAYEALIPIARETLLQDTEPVGRQAVEAVTGKAYRIPEAAAERRDPNVTKALEGIL